MNNNGDLYINIENVIKEEQKKYSFFKVFITSFLYKRVTFVLSKKFSLKRANPNAITLMMLVSTIIACTLFFVPSIYAIIAGGIVIQFFEIFDDIDGIVARATNNLSKKGEQLDFLMHLICHPIMMVSYGYLIFKYTTINSVFGLDKILFFVILFSVFLILELMMRVITSLFAITKYKLRDQENNNPNNTKESWGTKIKNMIHWGLDMFRMFPLIALIMPVFIILDFYLKLNFAFWYTVICVGVYILSLIKIIIFLIIDYCKYPNGKK